MAKRKRMVLVAAVVALSAGGCLNKPKQQVESGSIEQPTKLERATAEPIKDMPVLATPKTQSTPTERATVPPQPSVPEADSAEVLARKTEDYSQQMQQLMEKREAAKQQQQQQQQANGAAVGQPAAAPNHAGQNGTGQANPAPVTAAHGGQNGVAAQPVSPVAANGSTATPGNTPNTPAVPERSVEATANMPVAVDESPAAAPAPVKQGPARPVAPVVNGLEQQLAGRLRDNPESSAAHLDYQLLQFLEEKPVPDLASLAGINDEERDVIVTLMDGLSNYRTSLRTDSRQLLSQQIKPILEMSDRLRAQAELNIAVIQLCTRVNAFGVYDAIEPARFVGGKDHPVIVYCELQNFSSQLNEQQRWITRLTQELVLYTESGVPVWEDRAQEVIDVSRTRRHDFFIRSGLKLPANLTLGRYTLKVTIKDQLAERFAEASIPVDIVAQMAPPAVDAGNGVK